MATQNITKTITGTLRDTSKQANRALRAEKRVPAILYGPEITENINFSVDEIELERILNKNQTKLQILTIEGKEYKTLLKRTDFDPVTDRPIHVDFYVLSNKHRVTLRVPIKITGNARGVVEGGGRLLQPMVSVRIRVYPEFIPTEYVLDVTSLKIGDALHVKDLNLEGIEPIDSVDRTIVTIQRPKAALEVDTEELEDDELAEGEEAAEGEDSAESTEE
ncbi:MAG: 50S ribosomal protein L25 [Balneolaceae bacterium]